MALSRNAVDKLGERLRAGSTTEADWTLLEDLRTERQRQLTATVAMLREVLGIEVTSRVKTNNTLVEKLQRERMRFSQMDDLAGARIKVEGTRLDQDVVVNRLLGIWPVARVKDRRAQPAHGYRAVHVIPTVDGWPLEIQIRTQRQDAIANMLERLADDWGRQIRYGGSPDQPDAAGLPGGALSRSELLAMVHRISDVVATVETTRARTADRRTLSADAIAARHRAEQSTDDAIAAVAGLLGVTDE